MQEFKRQPTGRFLITQGERHARARRQRMELLALLAEAVSLQ